MHAHQSKGRVLIPVAEIYFQRPAPVSDWPARGRRLPPSGHRSPIGRLEGGTWNVGGGGNSGGGAPQIVTSADVREMTFQNVVDTVLKPGGVKVGGFPEEMFLDLTEDESEKLICNIWWVYL